MREVVIVEAVRSPARQAQRRACRHALDRPARPGPVRGRSSAAASTRAEIGQVIGGCVGQVGMQTMNVTRNAWLAAGAADRGRRDDGRHPVRLVAAGDQPRLRAGHVRRGRRGDGLRRRADEPDPDGLDDPEGSGGRGAGQQELLAALRVDLPVRGRRADRQAVGDHARGRDAFGLLSQDRAARGLGRRTLRLPDRADRRARSASRTASPPKQTHRVTRDGGLRETTLEGAGRTQDEPARRRPHGGTRPRRSPTAPARCC